MAYWLRQAHMYARMIRGGFLCGMQQNLGIHDELFGIVVERKGGERVRERKGDGKRERKR